MKGEREDEEKEDEGKEGEEDGCMAGVVVGETMQPSSSTNRSAR